MARRQIATYGPDRILVADLCPVNQDEWSMGSLLNFQDLITACFGTLGQCRKARMCGPNHCVEIEAVPGGFIAYEVIRGNCNG